MRSAAASLVLVVASSSVGAAQVPAGGEFRVNTYTTADQSEPRVAMDPSGRFAVVWTGSTACHVPRLSVLSHSRPCVSAMA